MHRSSMIQVLTLMVDAAVLYMVAFTLYAASLVVSTPGDMALVAVTAVGVAWLLIRAIHRAPIDGVR